MRRLGMKNKRRKSESDSELEENVGARAASDDADNGETQAGRNNNSARRSATKRRSSRGASEKKPAANADDGSEAADTGTVEAGERENGEKIGGQRPSPNKRRKKEDRASTSAREKSGNEDEYEVWRCLLYRSPSPLSARRRSPVAFRLTTRTSN